MKKLHSFLILILAIFSISMVTIIQGAGAYADNRISVSINNIVHNSMNISVNSSDNVEGCTGFVAVYDQDRNLVGVDVSNTPTDSSFNLSINTAGYKNVGEYIVSAFIWNGYQPVSSINQVKIITVEKAAYDDEKYYSDYEAVDAMISNDAQGKIWYYKSSEKKDTPIKYSLSSEFKFYVNGVECGDKFNDIRKYLLNNLAGTVSFIDTDNNGVYEIIDTEYYATAIVSSVNKTGKVYFDSNINTDAKYYIYLNSNDLLHTVKLDGEEISYTDLKEDDVLNIAYDVFEGFEYSTFYEVLVSRDTDQGQLTETDSEANMAYINDTYYSCVEELINVDYDFELGYEYKVLLDSFGRIVRSERSWETIKYGIVYRAYENNDLDEKMVVLYDKTAKLNTFIVKNGSQAEMEFDSGLSTVGNNVNVQECVVEYEVHSSGELKTIKPLLYVGGADMYYRELIGRIGLVKFNDISAMVYYDGDKCIPVEKSMLYDDNSYTAYGYNNINNFYGFVLITDGVLNLKTTIEKAAYDNEKYATLEDAIAGMLAGGGQGQIWYYDSSDKIDESSSYSLSDDFKLLVNNVEVEVNSENISTYLLNNLVGNVSFIDENRDKVYEAIDTEYYTTALVTKILDGKVYFNSGVNSGEEKYIDFGRQDLNYKINYNLEEISYLDIAEGDILSITYNVVEGFDNSSFYNIILPRTVINGTVTKIDSDNNSIYINDVYYSCVEGLVDVRDDFLIGCEYKIVLDSFGRIACVKNFIASVNYGVVYRTFENSNLDEKTVVLYDKTAKLDTFIVKDGSQAESAFDAGLLALDNVDVQKCVVEYTVNSKNELETINYLESTQSANMRYEQENKAIGSLSFNNNTTITYFDGNTYSFVNSSMLEDGHKYTAYGYNQEHGIYDFILITDGIGEYTTDTRFAVVDKKFSATNSEGDYCHKLSVYVAGSTDLQVVATENVDVAKGVEKGDVVVYKLNANGDIDEITVLFDNPVSFVNYAVTEKGDFSTLFENNPWDNDENVELVFGPVVSKSLWGVSIGQVGAPAVELKDYNGNVVTTDLVTNLDDTEELFYASNVAIYVYDYNNSTSIRLSVGDSISVPKMLIGKTVKLYDDIANEYIDWNGTETPYYPYAFAKVVKDEVTDLFVIIPKFDY